MTEWKIEIKDGGVYERANDEWAKEVVDTLLHLKFQGFTVTRLDKPAPPPPEPEIRYTCGRCAYWSPLPENVQRHFSAAHIPRKRKSKASKAPE